MNQNLKTALIAAAGVLAGGVTGYFIGGAIVTQKTQKMLDLFIEQTNADYEDFKNRHTKSGEYSTVEGAAAVLLPPKEEDEPGIQLFEDEEPIIPKDFIDQFHERVNGPYGGVSFPGQVESATNADEEDDVPISSVPGFLSVRDPNGPYVISIDDYMDDAETPFEKVEMTYFEGDDTLVDARNQIVPDIDGVVGKKNFDKWGQGTTDPNQVYVRNERLELDIEITRDDNTYTRAVLHIIPEEEVQRSMTKPLKMREGDDR
jgi:hypothetical protein